MFLFNNEEISGYARFRIPGAVFSAAGTLLACCEARRADDDWAEIDILLRKSRDGGLTFGAPVVLASGGREHKTVNNPVLIAAKDGALHLLYCVEYGLREEGGGVFYRRSTDDGDTWSEPREITDGTAPERRNVFATGPGHGIQLADGTLFVPCWTVLRQHGAERRSHHPGAVCCLTSRDGGATWGIASFVPQGQLKDPNETAAAQLPDGTVILSVRDGDTHCRCFSASRDGVHFSPMEPLPDLPDPVCCAGLTAAPDGLYLTHCHHPQERQNLTLLKSADGRSWETVATVDSGSAGYSDLAFSGTTLLVLYEKEAAIALAAFPASGTP